MLRFNSIENSEPRMKIANVEFSSESIVGPDATDPNLFAPAQPGGQAQGICGEEIRSVDTDFNSNRRIAVDFPVNDSDEFEAVVTGAVASSDFENQTFDVDADPITDAKSEKINIAAPGTQFIYMRTVSSSNTEPAKNVAIFRFNRSAGAQVTS